MIERDSTSYPTLAVIQEFGLEGKEVEAAYKMSFLISQQFFIRYGKAPNEKTRHENSRKALAEVMAYHDEFMAILPGFGLMVENRLRENCDRAVQWCIRDAAKKEAEAKA